MYNSQVQGSFYKMRNEESIEDNVTHVKLEVLNRLAEQNLHLDNTITKISNRSIRELDFRRQIIIECCLREYLIHSGEIAQYVLDPREADRPYDIQSFFKKCFKPIEKLGDCYLQDLFVDLFFVNGGKCILDINEILNRSDANRREAIVDLYNDLRFLLEEFFISLRAINLSCILYKEPCTCSKTDYCSCESRGSELILFYSKSYGPLHEVILKYLEIGKRYFDKNVVTLVIDFEFVSFDDPVYITKQDEKAIAEASRYYKDVYIRNTRYDKIKIQDTLRDNLAVQFYEMHGGIQ